MPFEIVLFGNTYWYFWACFPLVLPNIFHRNFVSLFIILLLGFFGSPAFAYTSSHLWRNGPPKAGACHSGTSSYFISSSREMKPWSSRYFCWISPPISCTVTLSSPKLNSSGLQRLQLLSLCNFPRKPAASSRRFIYWSHCICPSMHDGIIPENRICIIW